MKTELIVGFTGTREGMTPEQKKAVSLLLQELKPACVVHGDCVGADADFDEIAATLEIPRNLYPCNINSARAHRELCGAVQVAEPDDPLTRNSVIVNVADMLIATPKEYEEVLRSGTWATIRRARKKAKMDLLIVLPNGEIA